MNKELITLGEAMIVFIAENEGDFTDIENFSKGIAGAELNVSMGLSRLGHKVSYITRLGKDVFGNYIEDVINKEGILSDSISKDSDYSTGFYFKTKVKDGDPEVHYFRKNSAASQITCKDIESTDFSGAKILHITGITAALSESTLDAVYKAIDKARENNMLITFDPNIRVQLWKSEEYMIEVLNNIASKCDVILPGIKEGVSKTFWTCSKDGVIKAPLSKGAANKLLEAIYWRGIHAVGVYEFAEGIGEFVHGTANPSTTFGGPPPFDKGGFAQKPSSPTFLTYT